MARVVSVGRVGARDRVYHAERGRGRLLHGTDLLRRRPLLGVEERCGTRSLLSLSLFYERVCTLEREGSEKARARKRSAETECSPRRLFRESPSLLSRNVCDTRPRNVRSRQLPDRDDRGLRRLGFEIKGAQGFRALLRLCRRHSPRLRLRPTSRGLSYFPKQSTAPAQRYLDAACTWRVSLRVSTQKSESLLSRRRTPTWRSSAGAPRCSRRVSTTGLSPRSTERAAVWRGPAVVPREERRPTTRDDPGGGRRAFARKSLLRAKPV